ncbi:MAG: trigger factor [bacterium]
MKVEITKLPKSEIELKVEVPSEEWQEFINEAAKELSRDLKIEGFRPGHAPSKMVEERIGLDKILEKATDLCVKKCYVEAILDDNIQAIGRPEISVTKIAKDNPFEFKARLAVLPEVKLPDYKKIARDAAKDKKEISISEEEINKSLEWLQRSRTKYSTVARPAQAGDRAEVDFEGECEGEKLPELCSKNHPAVLGRGYFMPGFEENLLGMKEGEEKQFSLLLREDFEPKRLAGKMIDFRAKMNLVQESKLPELNDAFAQGIGSFKDLAALQASVKDGVLAEKKEQERDRWRTKLIEEIAKKSNMEIPEIMVEGEVHRMLDELKAKISQVGLTYEQYLERFKKTEQILHEEFEKIAGEKVRAYLTLKEIAMQEKIEVSEEEVTKEVDQALRHFAGQEQAEKNIDLEQLKEYSKDVLKNRKVFEILENDSV